MEHHHKSQNETATNLISLDQWREQLGKTAATIWRWRKRGWIETVNVAGRLYVSRDVIAKFERRAALGEFSQVHKTPGHKNATTKKGTQS